MASAQEVEMLRRQLDELTAQMITENSETITSSGDGDSTTRTAVCNLAVPSHDAHTGRSTESRQESWKQRFRSLSDNCA